MPEISRFFGIVIQMFYNDHQPPHFHASYSGSSARFAIQTLEVMDAGMSARAHALVLEWAATHRVELMANWERARRQQPLSRIAPLE